jgi:Ca-activated chloride channel family protein
MPSRRTFVSSVLTTLFAASAPVRAAQGKNKDDSIELDSDLITVDFTAVDAQGERVKDLKQSEVRVLDDGKVRDLAFFDASSVKDLSRPLAVVLALDISGSIKPEEIPLQRKAALRFVDLVRPESLFAVITFNHEVKVLQKFTNKASDISRAFDRISDIGGSTRLLDTLDQAVTMLKKAPAVRGGRRLRRVIVTITDGYDSASVIDPNELVRRAAGAGATIYALTLPSYVRSLDGKRTRVPTLLEIAGVVPATGGLDFSADSNDLGPFFQAIAEEVTTGYQLAFYPPEASRRDGKFHQIRVEVTRPGVTVRASRQGYQIE